MVLEGNGLEAVVLSAAGSMLSVVFGFAVALPVTYAMVRFCPTVSAWIPAVLVATVIEIQGGYPRL